MKNKLKNGGECGNTGNLRLRLTGGELVVCLLRGKFTGTSRGEESAPGNGGPGCLVRPV